MSPVFLHLQFSNFPSWDLIKHSEIIRDFKELLLMRAISILAFLEMKTETFSISINQLDSP